MVFVIINTTNCVLIFIDAYKLNHSSVTISIANALPVLYLMCKCDFILPCASEPTLSRFHCLYRKGK